LGNKFDIFQQDEKTLLELKKIAAHYSTELLLTSAKTGQHVQKAFLIQFQKMRAKA